MNRNELEAARNYWIAAEKRKEVAEAGLVEAKKKNLEAYNQVCSLTEELGKAKRQLSELKVCDEEARPNNTSRYLCLISK